MKKRALIHVENTQQLENLATYLNKTGWEILSSNKTETFLKSLGIPVVNVPSLEANSRFTDEYSSVVRQVMITRAEESDFTEQNIPAILKPEDRNEISLVCINIRPTLHTISLEHQLEKIIKPSNYIIASLLRTAFINADNVLLLTDPDDYQEAILQIMTDNITSEFRSYLAAKALNMVAAYDSGLAYTILHSPQIDNKFMNYLTIPYTKHTMYEGSNPHQQSCLYSLPSETGVVSGLAKVDSQNIDYNLTSDISLAWELISTLYTKLKSQYTVKSTNADGYDFTTQFTPLTGTVFTLAIKFRSIVGAALSTNAVDSILETSNFDSDIEDVSLGCSSVIDKNAALEIVKRNYQAIVAPAFSDEAEEILNKKAGIKLIPTAKVFTTEFDGRLINGGLILQTKDTQLFEHWQVKTRIRPDQNLIDEMAFGTLLTLGTRSYSAILLQNNHIVAIAQSWTTNKKALDQICIPITDLKVKGDLLVSDSPISYCDSIRYIIDNGLKAILQPGGTNTDGELVEYCNEHGVVMIFTGMTHIKI